MDITVNNYMVFEYTDKAGLHYCGARFMTSDDGQPIAEVESMKVVARGLSEKEAHILVTVTVEKNIEAYLSDIPDGLRNPTSDAIIGNMIRNGSQWL